MDGHTTSVKWMYIIWTYGWTRTRILSSSLSSSSSSPSYSISSVDPSINRCSGWTYLCMYVCMTKGERQLNGCIHIDSLSVCDWLRVSDDWMTAFIYIYPCILLRIRIVVWNTSIVRRQKPILLSSASCTEIYIIVKRTILHHPSIHPSIHPSNICFHTTTSVKWMYIPVHVKVRTYGWVTGLVTYRATRFIIWMDGSVSGMVTYPFMDVVAGCMYVRHVLGYSSPAYLHPCHHNRRRHPKASAALTHPLIDNIV